MAPLTSFVLALLASVPEMVSGHSWVEQANRIAANGTLVGPAGFPGQWYGRESPQFNDQAVTNSLTPENTKLCAKQPLGDQVDGFDMLTAAPGDFIALRYLENGHVTNIEPNRAENRGTVYVYGTTDPRDDDITDVFKKWTADGQGGDGRGRLLATRHYDDGQCYEANDQEISQERQQKFPKVANDVSGPNLWCQTDVQIPDDIPQDSQYAIYWIWTWPLLQDIEGTDDGHYGDYAPGEAPEGGDYLEDEGVMSGEVYSSCISINIDGEPLVEADEDFEDDSPESLSSFVSNKFETDRTDWNDAAVKEQLENQFLVDAGADGSPESGEPGDSDQGPPSSDAPTESVDAPVPSETSTLRTVTVTAEPTTVYATATVTIEAGDSDPTAPVDAPDTPEDAPEDVTEGESPEEDAPADPVETVDSFMIRRNIRARDSWSFF